MTSATKMKEITRSSDGFFLTHSLIAISESLAFLSLSTVRHSNNQRKLDLFLSSGDGRETPTLLHPLDRATSKPFFLREPSHQLRIEIDPVS
jgi:hypothetical protein